MAIEFKKLHKSIIDGTITNNRGEESFLYQITPPDLEQIDIFEIDQFIDSAKSVLNFISGKQIKVYFLNGKFFLNIFDKKKLSINDLQYIKVIPDFSELFGNKTLFSYPEFKTDHLKLNGQYFRFITVKNLKRVNLCGLMNFGDYYFSFEKRSSLVSKIRLDLARKENYSKLYKEIEDIEGTKAFKNNEEMLKSLMNGEEQLFKGELFFIVKADTELELKEKTVKLISELQVKEFDPFIETEGLNYAFDSYIFGTKSKFERLLDLHTSLLLNMLPLTASRLMNEGYLFKSRSGHDLKFSLFNGDSFSAIITGVTGKGKTFLCQKIIDEELKLDRNVVICDPKGDFQKFIKLNNAHIIQNKVNPMMFKDDLFFLRDFIISKTKTTNLLKGKLLKALRSVEHSDFFTLLQELGTFDPDLSIFEYLFEDMKGMISDKKRIKK